MIPAHIQTRVFVIPACQYGTTTGEAIRLGYFTYWKVTYRDQNKGTRTCLCTEDELVNVEEIEQQIAHDRLHQRRQPSP